MCVIVLGRTDWWLCCCNGICFVKGRSLARMNISIGAVAMMTMLLL